MSDHDHVEEAEKKGLCKDPSIKLTEVEPTLNGDLAMVSTDVFPNLGENYTVVEKVGQGGMGTVYQVHDNLLNRTLAVKVLRPELAADQSALKRFDQESRALSELNHPNIVAVFSSGKTDQGAPYVVMDHIGGQNLSTVIKNLGGMDAGRALNIFIEICDALHHAHDKGIIHRDLKPSNIILSKSESGEESPRVVDFGIAKVISKTSGETVTGLTQMGDVFGTPTYMSPEQCQGDKLDARSDIYSLGCVMFETLSGAPPFTESNPFKLMTKHVSEKAPVLTTKGVSSGLAGVVAKCLEKEPEKRYQTVDELMKDLVAVRKGEKPLYARPVVNPNDVTLRTKVLDYFQNLTLKDIMGYVYLIVFSAPFLIVWLGYAPSMPSQIADTAANLTIPTKSGIDVQVKPNVPKPKLGPPQPFPAPKEVAIANPLTETERSQLRAHLYKVDVNRAGTFEPILAMGNRAIPALLDEVKGSDKLLSQAASMSLTRFGDAALPGLIKLFREDTSPAIAIAIEQMGDSGVKAIAPCLHDQDPQVRARAATAIKDATRYKMLTAHLGQQLLWLILEDPDPIVREEAAKTVSRTPIIENVREVLAYAALNDQAPLVRAAAIQSFVSIADRDGDQSKRTLDIMGWVVQHDASDIAKTALLPGSYMSNYGEPFAPYLKVAYQTGSVNVKKSIIAVCRVPSIGEQLLPELVSSLKDNSIDSYAISALENLGPRARPALPALRGYLLSRPAQSERWNKWARDYQASRIENAIKQISK
jgi:serine/threonine protein kinase